MMKKKVSSSIKRILLLYEQVEIHTFQKSWVGICFNHVSPATPHTAIIPRRPIKEIDKVLFVLIITCIMIAEEYIKDQDNCDNSY